MSDASSAEKKEAWRPRAFSAPKADGQINEDAWQFSHKGIGALSDGASISFDSASWARILVRHYARDPCFDGAWLAAASQEFAALHDRESLSWVQQGAFDRGSFASLLGLRRDEARIEVLAIGDSIAVLCDADRVVATFPYESPEQFDQRPLLLSTNPAQNVFLAEHDTKPNFSVKLGRSARWPNHRSFASATRSATGLSPTATMRPRRLPPYVASRRAGP